MSNRIKKEIFSWIQVIVMAFIIAFILKTFIFRPVYVKGPSMDPTLSDGQILILWKLNYQIGDPNRGDVIVIGEDEDELQNKSLIKRVIGIPGDIIEIKNGDVYVNNEKLNPDYVKDNTAANGFSKSVLPNGQYFVLGDNRGESRDSRDKSVGFIERENIEGKTVFRLWPLNKIGIIH